jgi:hypothetical protein
MKALPATALLLVVVLSGAALAYSSGPPPGRTGAPAEGTCADCHDNLNNGTGWLTVSAPNEYAPGDTVDVFARLGVQVGGSSGRARGGHLLCGRGGSR